MKLNQNIIFLLLILLLFSIPFEFSFNLYKVEFNSCLFKNLVISLQYFLQLLLLNKLFIQSWRSISEIAYRSEIFWPKLLTIPLVLFKLVVIIYYYPSFFFWLLHYSFEYITNKKWVPFSTKYHTHITCS